MQILQQGHGSLNRLSIGEERSAGVRKKERERNGKEGQMRWWSISRGLALISASVQYLLKRGKHDPFIFLLRAALNDV